MRKQWNPVTEKEVYTMQSDNKKKGVPHAPKINLTEDNTQAQDILQQKSVSALQDLLEDYKALKEKYEYVLHSHEFNFAMIQISVKTLMDEAPRHGIALETIKRATEEGIKWHVEYKNKEGK